jgi:hypothetical protein
MYKTMYELLTGHAPLTDIVPVERFYEAGSTTDRPYSPYVVLGWLPDLQKASGRYVKLFELRVHDERGSYARSRQILAVARDLMESVLQYEGSDGWLTECSYAGDGGELVDPDTNTNLMTASFEVVGRTTVYG